MGVSASEKHSRKNAGMTTKKAVARIVPMAKRAISAGKPTQVSIQSAFGCGMEGAIPAARVLEIVRTYLDAGLRMISLADSAGHALPGQVRDLYGAVFALDSEPTVRVSLSRYLRTRHGEHPRGARCRRHPCRKRLCGARWVPVHRGYRWQSLHGGLRVSPPAHRPAAGCAPRAHHSVASAASEFFERVLPGTVPRIGPINVLTSTST